MALMVSAGCSTNSLFLLPDPADARTFLVALRDNEAWSAHLYDRLDAIALRVPSDRLDEVVLAYYAGDPCGPSRGP